MSEPGTVGASGLRRTATRLAPPVFSVVALVAIITYVGHEGLVDEVGSLPVWAAVVAFGVILVRDAVLQAGGWWTLITFCGHRVPFFGVARIYMEFTAVKFLLPFKLGDAMRVVALREAHGVPIRQGAASRLLSMVLRLTMILALAAGLFAATQGWPIVAIGVGVATAAIGSTVSLVVLARLTGSVQARSIPAGLFAVLLAAGAVAFDGLLYVVMLPGLRDGAFTAQDLFAIAATLVGCAIPLSSRGIGARELVLTTLGSSWGLASAPQLLAAGLAISAVEVVFVVAVAIGIAAWRLTLSARPAESKRRS